MTDSIAYGAEPSRSLVVSQGISLVSRLLDLDAASPTRSTLSRVFGTKALSGNARREFEIARADVSVARELAHLGAAWTVYRCVGASEGIDLSTRVVSGPGGVFLINSVNEPDEDLWVDDFVLAAGTQRSSGINQAKKAAKAVSEALSTGRGKGVQVTPVIVVTAARSVTYAKESTRVLVLGIERLSRWISQRPQHPTRADLAQLNDAAHHHDAGASLSFVLDDTLDFGSDFDLLAARVQGAQRRMVTWIEVAAVAVVAAALLLLLL